MQAVERTKVNRGRLYNEHTIRYMFYGLRSVDFSGSQSKSPVFIPKFPKQEFVSLESFTYKATDDTDSMYDDEGNQKGLIDRVMGTNAQVEYIMGDNISGLRASGMTYISSLTGVDIKTASEIENLILEGKKFDNLLDLRTHLINKSRNVTGDLADLAKEVLRELIQGVDTGIAYCNRYAREIEEEINNAKTGKKLAIKTGLDERDMYIYDQVRRPYPEDRAGANAGSELAKVLAPLIGGGTYKTPEQEFDEQMKAERVQSLERELAEANRLIQEMYDSEKVTESEDSN